MNITPQETTQPISDDQDLAKALAGVLPDEPETAEDTSSIDLQFEETPALPVIQLATEEPQTAEVAQETAEPEQSIELPQLPVIETPVVPSPAETAAGPEVLANADANDTLPQLPSLDTPGTSPEPATAPSGLDNIKNKALDELRPLINRADLPAEEKFDTYLMLIRSTDDASLIEPAHEAAQAITDETRKAEALIDIIKEIDYLSKKNK